MALLETIHLEHLPPTYSIHIALYQNLKNAPFLHQQLLAGNTDFEYAFIDASIILSRIHILSAVHRALNALLSNRLKSRNIHSEIVFSLSPNNNISQSYQTFGLTPSTTSLLLLKISTPTSPISASAVAAHLERVVEGEGVRFSDENLRGGGGFGEGEGGL